MSLDTSNSGVLGVLITCSRNSSLEYEVTRTCLILCICLLSHNQPIFLSNFPCNGVASLKAVFSSISNFLSCCNSLMVVMCICKDGLSLTTHHHHLQSVVYDCLWRLYFPSPARSMFSCLLPSVVVNVSLFHISFHDIFKPQFWSASIS